MQGAYSGTLLEADLLGASAAGSGAPAFLGCAEGAGAACDPAIFLLEEPEAEPGRGRGSDGAPPPLGAAAAPGFCPSREASSPLLVPRRGEPASARDLLRELESSLDFLLPGQPYESMLLDDGDAWGAALAPPATLSPALSPATPSSGWQPAPTTFPAIPEEAELPPAALAAPALPPLSPGLASSALAHSPPPALLFPFVPVPAAGPLLPMPKLTLPASPVATAEAVGSSSGSEVASPTASSTSSQPAQPAGLYPRIASMPNLHLSLGEASSGAAPAPPPRKRAAASGRSRALPRSRSHSDLRSGGASGTPGGELERYNVPHLPFLTPPHLRKGKGGRQPASDPRLDPNIDPKRARRIMANRLSAAKSKMRQKSAVQAEAQRSQMMRLQRDGRVPDSEPEEAGALEAPPPPPPPRRRR